MKNIPLVDLKAQMSELRGELDQIISDNLDNTAFIGGKPLQKFESEFAAFSKARFAVGASSGTTALHLALIGAGVSAGDEVIVPSHTFIATIEAIYHCGAKPVFIDIEENSYLLNPELIQSKITEKTKAIIAVHLYGRLCDMRRITEIADKYKIAVVEDAAQAHGAESNFGRAGASGITSAFSFYPGKNLGACGDAGIVTTSDESIYKKLKMLANHGREGKYEHQFIGYNYRMDALQASILSAKLKHLPKWNTRRNSLAFRYNELLANESNIILPQVIPGHVFHLYVIRTLNRDAIIAKLRAKGISCGVHYPIPCHKQPCINSDEKLAVTEKIAGEILSLPLFPELSVEDQNYIVSSLKSALKEVSANISAEAKPKIA